MTKGEGQSLGDVLPLRGQLSPAATAVLAARPSLAGAVAESGRCRGRDAQLRALKKETSGRMQRPPELVPIHEYLLGTSGRLRKVAAYGKNPEEFGQNLAKIQQNFGNICEIFVNNQLQNV